VKRHPWPVVTAICVGYALAVTLIAFGLDVLFGEDVVYVTWLASFAGGAWLGFWLMRRFPWKPQ
jgi:threonine/homoserine/homoserine lactone efflux protein